MTINQLIKRLEKLRDDHGKTVTVCADTHSLRQSCNEVWEMIEITEVDFDFVPLVDGDGFREFTKDGTERVRRTIVLK